MSLFSFGGGGDIWSSAGFAFVSPINDILDKDDFTLEEILSQDEVLQEVKSLNVKLVEFLCKEESVRQMMAYIAEAPRLGAEDERIFKFPYMSCEIICCEVPHILNAVANDTDSAPLAKLFSLLDEDGDIDAHRAGYLEKILTVLLKHRCGPTTTFLNAGGLELFRKMVVHLGNFSVMQVAKLLLLPKYVALQGIDSATMMGDGRGPDGSEGSATHTLWCNWSEDPKILQALLREFEGTGSGDEEASLTPGEGEGQEGGGVGSEDGGGARNEGDGGEGDIGERSDIHLHLSELLLALIGHCSPESSFLKRMFSKEAVDPLVSAAKLTKEQGREAKGSQAALQILAALANRLVRPQPPSTSALVQGGTTEMQVEFDHFGDSSDDQDGGKGDGDEELATSGLGRTSLHRPVSVRELLKVDGDDLERGLREIIPSLCAYLRGHTEDPSMIPVQIREEQPRLGSLRLQVVRFIETLVGMDNRAIDQELMAEHAMATCLEMMFTYESSSMLHASVSGAVLNILGAAPLPPPPLGVDEATASAWVADTAEAAKLAAKSGRREPFQRHLFEDCRLVERILEAVALNEDAEKGSKGAPSDMDEIGEEGETASAGARAGGGEPADIASATKEAETAGEKQDSSAESPLDGETASTADEAAPSGEGVGGPVASSDGKGDAALAGGGAEAGIAGAGLPPPRRGRRLGHMGHVLLLSNAVVDAQYKEPREGVGEQSARGVREGVEGPKGAGGEGGEGKVGREGDGRGDEDESDWRAAAGLEKEGPSAGKSFVAALVSRRECSEQWQEYVSTTLKGELARQQNPLGGFPVPSREAENQLSSDFPDEAVDMDDTTGILENIARMQSATGMIAGHDQQQQLQGVGGAMNDTGDLDDDDIDFEGMDSGGGGGGGLSSNNALTMMFGSGNFMSSSGGSAWGSLTGNVASSAGDGNGDGSTSAFGDSSSGVSEGWANFADFGDPQPVASAASGTSAQSGGASGSAGAGGAFANFDSVFAIDSLSTSPAGGGSGVDPGPGPNAFAPSPPTWGTEAGAGGAAGNSGAGSAGGGFADFSQYGGFADFSVLMEDTLSTPDPIATSPTSPPTTAVGGGGDGGERPRTPPASAAGEGMMESSPDPQAFGEEGTRDNDRMDDTEEGEGPEGGQGTGKGAIGASQGAGGSPGREPMDSTDAMVGSDDGNDEDASSP